MQDIFIQFGKNVQRIRLKRNLTLEEVSLKTGIKVNYLKRIEKGEAKGVSTKHLLLFMEAFQARPIELLKDI